MSRKQEIEENLNQVREKIAAAAKKTVEIPMTSI
jgi:hypothetical protein